MLDTLFTSLKLSMTYRGNGFLYALKQIPLIKKLLPDKLYSIGGLKSFLTVISIVVEFFSTFFRKALYIGLFVFLPLFLLNDGNWEGLSWEMALHLLLFLTLVGSMNNKLIEASRDKYYAIFLLKADARKYTLSNYGYFLFSTLLGFGLAGPVLALIMDAPIWQGLLIPFFVIGVKITWAAIMLKHYDKKGTMTLSPTVRGTRIFLAGMLLASGYAPIVIAGWHLPGIVTLGIMACFIVAGLLLLIKVFRYPNYSGVCKNLINSYLELIGMAGTTAREVALTGIDTKASFTSKKEGFEFLNELFIKRHRKILWNASRLATYIVMGILGVAFIVAMFFRWKYADNEVMGAINTFFRGQFLSMSAFMIYFMNRGASVTQALFMNCDRSLLTYSFFKEPGAILKLFRIRLIEISKINLLPASVMAAGVCLIVFATGGAKTTEYLVIVVTILALSIFFSVHYLAMYYLLQPYNAETEMQSKLYGMVMGITYGICYAMMRIPIPFMAFGIVASAFCVGYALIACILVYYLSPKTFKLRS